MSLRILKHFSYLYSMNITDSSIEDYCLVHSSQQDAVLKELERQTHVTQLWPQMLSGEHQIALLKMLVMLHQPKISIEIGTFTGYSAIAMAQALPKGGLLHTIEVNEELETMIMEFFRKAKVEQKIQLHIGDAKQKIEEIEGPFDLAFIDADKESYPIYFELLMPKMNAGAIIIADNVLWGAKVVQPIKESDRQTLAIDKFNKMIIADDRVENVLIPIRDGLNVIRVK